MTGKKYDLSGKRFGNLLAKKSVGKTRNGAYIWECLCDCGNIRNVRSSYLGGKGIVTSCGCKYSLYYTWSTMMARCYNPKNKKFHRYGGRGINVCSEWHSMENFHRDMRDPPSKDYTLGRIDNDKGYSPYNCRWETHEQQANNRSTNKLLTYMGETKTMAQWAKKYNLNPKEVFRRLKLGWPIENVLLTPVKKQRRKQCNEDFKSVDFPQPQPFTKEVFDEAIAMIEKWDFTIEKGG